MHRYPVIADLIAGMPESIWSGCNMIKLPKGKPLFHQDDKVGQVYILCSGTVIISNHTAGGNEIGIVLVKAGNTIGEMEALASGKSMRYNARAHTPCQLIVLPGKSFLEWMDRDPKACRIMASVLAHKLYDASTQVGDQARYHAIVRIASFILSEEAGRLSITRQEMAETCRMSIRTVNRCLKQLKEEKLISINRGKIHMTPDQKERLGSSIYNLYLHES